MPNLYAGRFSGSVTNGSMYESFQNVERIGIRWDIERFGIERIEVTVAAKSRLDQYDRINSHFGGDNEIIHRLAIFDDMVYDNVSGFITGIRPEGTRKVTYIAKGVGWSHYDQYGPTYTSYTASTTTSFLLKEFLADDMQVVMSDLSNIDETSTALGGWQHPSRIGIYPGDYIQFLKKAGSSSGQIWDYYCLSEPMQWGKIANYIPYLKNRGNRTDVNWRVSIDDLSRLDLDQDMSEFRSNATIFYGTYTGTATGGSGTTLQDSGASFLDGRFNAGDEVRNITDGSSARINSISSNTQINLTTLTGGSGNNFAASDVYAIQSKTPWNNDGTGSYSTFHYANRRITEHRPELSATQAAQYSQALFNFYSVPVQSAAFTISSPWIRDANGARRPLWAPIFEGGGLIQITDLYPAAAVSLTNDGTNNLDTFFITAMDYDYTTNQLRVSVNVPDSKLDARLAANKILGSAGIARGVR